ncbi:FAD-binding oxidoreductase [Halocalculus aciditolerans]|uniref:FAD-linked oxidase n=1 Tax=Halocalculus aciditolerans TaxID=1383812 RepID=A0A830F2S9_9EURY|nr:FAD-binding oxidoreductase [Halocalculus aciditolerans]GGL57094.1 FAD-linked oxidase [Halocalculus aciditolerans]
MTGYDRAVATRDAAAHAAALDDLAGTLTGRLVRPDDEGYDDARTVWNGTVDRHPVAVAHATDAADVRAVLTTARETDLGVAVRAGGHSGPGLSVCDGGLVLDVSAMDAVRIDPDAGTARVGAGAEWGDLDAAAQKHGLATPGGVVSDTGVAGLTLGGGTGWLTRAHGLACDRLTAVDLVTPAGERVTASADDHPDLFRALRGGGGNFGVALAFEFDLVPLPHDVAYCEVWYPLDGLDRLLADYRRRTARGSREANVSPFVAPRPDSPELGVCFMGAHAGPPVEGERELAAYADLGDPVESTVGRLPYTELQSMLDGDSPAGDRYYWKSIAVDDLTPDVVDVFAERARALPGPRDTALVWPMGGAVSDVAPDATAFPRRDAGYVLNFECAWTDPDADDAHVEWARESVAAVREHGGDGLLPNFPGSGTGDDAARAIYRDNYDWLRDVKTRYDPENVLDPSGRLDPR